MNELSRMNRSVNNINQVMMNRSLSNTNQSNEVRQYDTQQPNFTANYLTNNENPFTQRLPMSLYRPTPINPYVPQYSLQNRNFPGTVDPYSYIYRSQNLANSSPPAPRRFLNSIDDVANTNERDLPSRNLQSNLSYSPLSNASNEHSQNRIDFGTFPSNLRFPQINNNVTNMPDIRSEQINTAIPPTNKRKARNTNIPPKRKYTKKKNPLEKNLNDSQNETNKSYSSKQADQNLSRDSQGNVGSLQPFVEDWRQLRANNDHLSVSKPLKCNACNFETNDQANFEKHFLSKEHNQRLTNKDNLLETTNSEEHFENHISSTENCIRIASEEQHNKENFILNKLMTCHICDFQTNNVGNFDKHLCSEQHCEIKLSEQKSSDLRSAAMENAMGHPIFLLKDEAAIIKKEESENMEALCMEVLLKYDELSKNYNQSALVNKGSIVDVLTRNYSPISSTSETSDSFENQNSILPDDTVNIYQCGICMVFSTNSFSDLILHLNNYGTASSNGKQWMEVENETMKCIPCGYSIDNKTNFNTHTQSLKHIKEISNFYHVQERDISKNCSPSLIRCNVCDIEISSIDVGQYHIIEFVHSLNVTKYKKLNSCKAPEKHSIQTYSCKLCRTSFSKTMDVMKHFQTPNHKQLRDQNQINNDLDFVEILVKKTEDINEKDENSKVADKADKHTNESENLNVVYNVDLNVVRRVEGLCNRSENLGATSSSTCTNEKSTDQETHMLEVLGEKLVFGKKYVHGVIYFTCSFCPHIDTNKIDIQMHILKHARLFSKVNCPLCLVSFDNGDHWTNHVKTDHKVKEPGCWAFLVSMANTQKWISPGIEVRSDVAEWNPLSSPYYPNLWNLRTLLKEERFNYMKEEIRVVFERQVPSNTTEPNEVVEDFPES